MVTTPDGAEAPSSFGAVGYRPRDEPGVDGVVVAGGPLGAIGGFVVVLVAVLALREVASLVLPVILGLLIALVAWPMVGALEERGVGQGTALASTIAIVLAVVLLAAGIIALSVGELVVQIPLYETRLNAALSALREQIAQLGLAADPAAIGAVISPEKIFAFVRPVASAVAEAGGSMLVVAFTLIYALAGGTSFRSRAAAAFGEHHPLVRGMAEFGTDLRRYLIVRTELGLFAGVLSSAMLVALGVPLPVLWGVLVFFASFIPNIGSFIAVVPPTILAFLDGGLGAAAMVIAGYAVINFIQDQFLQPVVMGSQLNLSPLVVFIALVVWAWILGPAGALLAVPLTLGLVTILEAFPSSAGLASLFRNKLEPSAGAVA
jgi:predicted PurR-regulated permease PerM